MGHPAIQEPKDRQVKIWRYLDFPKFVSTLVSQGLFFVRVSNLPDKHEGSIPLANKRFRIAPPPEISPEVWNRAWNSLADFRKWVRPWTKVNCWHMNEVESEAMWRLYAGQGQSIAIQSTFARLRGVLKTDILCGEIKYVDFNTDIVPETDSLGPFMLKRKSFLHERELRAITMDEWPTKPGTSELDMKRVPTDKGTLVPVDLQSLIENIYVSPLAPKWYIDAVESVVQKYGLKCPVHNSSLDTDPFY